MLRTEHEGVKKQRKKKTRTFEAKFSEFKYGGDTSDSATLMLETGLAEEPPIRDVSTEHKKQQPEFKTLKIRPKTAKRNISKLRPQSAMIGTNSLQNGRPMSHLRHRRQKRVRIRSYNPNQKNSKEGQKTPTRKNIRERMIAQGTSLTISTEFKPFSRKRPFSVYTATAARQDSGFNETAHKNDLPINYNTIGLGYDNKSENMLRNLVKKIDRKNTNGYIQAKNRAKSVKIRPYCVKKRVISSFPGSVLVVKSQTNGVNPAEPETSRNQSKGLKKKKRIIKKNENFYKLKNNSLLQKKFKKRYFLGESIPNKSHCEGLGTKSVSLFGMTGNKKFCTSKQQEFGYLSRAVKQEYGSFYNMVNKKKRSKKENSKIRKELKKNLMMMNLESKAPYLEKNIDEDAPALKFNFFEKSKKKMKKMKNKREATKTECWNYKMLEKEKRELEDEKIELDEKRKRLNDRLLRKKKRDLEKLRLRLDGNDTPFYSRALQMGARMSAEDWEIPASSPQDAEKLNKKIMENLRNRVKNIRTQGNNTQSRTQKRRLFTSGKHKKGKKRSKDKKSRLERSRPISKSRNNLSNKINSRTPGVHPHRIHIVENSNKHKSLRRDNENSLRAGSPEKKPQWMAEINQLFTSPKKHSHRKESIFKRAPTPMSEIPEAGKDRENYKHSRIFKDTATPRGGMSQKINQIYKHSNRNSQRTQTHRTVNSRGTRQRKGKPKSMITLEKIRLTKKAKKVVNSGVLQFDNQFKLGNDMKYDFFEDYINKVNTSNKVKVTHGKYKYIKYKACIQPGFNNEELIKQCLRQRWWWTLVDNPKRTKIHMFWSGDDIFHKNILEGHLKHSKRDHLMITEDLMPPIEDLEAFLGGDYQRAKVRTTYKRDGGGESGINDLLIRGLSKQKKKMENSRKFQSNVIGLINTQTHDEEVKSKVVKTMLMATRQSKMVDAKCVVDIPNTGYKQTLKDEMKGVLGLGSPLKKRGVESLNLGVWGSQEKNFDESKKIPKNEKFVSEGFNKRSTSICNTEMMKVIYGKEFSLQKASFNELEDQDSGLNQDVGNQRIRGEDGSAGVGRISRKRVGFRSGQKLSKNLFEENSVLGVGEDSAGSEEGNSDQSSASKLDEARKGSKTNKKLVESSRSTSKVNLSSKQLNSSIHRSKQARKSRRSRRSQGTSRKTSRSKAPSKNPTTYYKSLPRWKKRLRLITLNETLLRIYEVHQNLFTERFFRRILTKHFLRSKLYTQATGEKKTVSNFVSMSSMDNFTTNRFEGTEILNSKEQLISYFQAFCRENLLDDSRFIPKTFLIKSIADVAFLRLKKEFYDTENLNKRIKPELRTRNVWIIKRAEKEHRGRPMFLTKSFQTIRTLILGGQVLKQRFIIQKFIERPLLIQKEAKKFRFEIRAMALVTFVQGSVKVYMYNDGYAKLIGLKEQPIDFRYLDVFEIRSRNEGNGFGFGRLNRRRKVDDEMLLNFEQLGTVLNMIWMKRKKELGGGEELLVGGLGKVAEMKVGSFRSIDRGNAGKREEGSSVSSYESLAEGEDPEYKELLEQEGFDFKADILKKMKVNNFLAKN